MNFQTHSIHEIKEYTIMRSKKLLPVKIVDFDWPNEKKYHCHKCHKEFYLIDLYPEYVGNHTFYYCSKCL
jgi:hypothetical protein